MATQKRLKKLKREGDLIQKEIDEYQAKAYAKNVKKADAFAKD